MTSDRSDVMAEGSYPPGWNEERAIAAAEIARAFHETYDALASHSHTPWLDVRTDDRKLLVALVVSLIERRVIAPRAEVERLREALTEIRDADPVDMALDPNWPARIAATALTPPSDITAHTSDSEQ